LVGKKKRKRKKERIGSGFDKKNVTLKTNKTAWEMLGK